MFALAQELKLPVAEVLDMPDVEYDYWCHFYSLNPWGWKANNLLTAGLRQAVLAPHCKRVPQLETQMLKLRPVEKVAQEEAIEFCAVMDYLSGKGTAKD